MIFWVVLTVYVFVEVNCASTQLPSSLNPSSVFGPMSSDAGRLSTLSSAIFSTIPKLPDPSSATPITPVVPSTFVPPTLISTTASSSPESSSVSGAATTQSVITSTSTPFIDIVSHKNDSSTTAITDSQSTIVVPFSETTLLPASTPIASTENNNGRMLLLLLLLLIVPVIIVIIIVIIVAYRHHRTQINQQTKMKIREYELKYNTMGNEAERDPGATNSIYRESALPVSMSDLGTGTVKSVSDDSLFQY